MTRQRDYLKDLQVAFEAFDMDGTGTMSFPELKGALLDDPADRVMGGMSRGLRRLGLGRLGPQTNADSIALDIDEVMRMTDTSGDGEIDSEEFVAIMTKT